MSNETHAANRAKTKSAPNNKPATLAADSGGWVYKPQQVRGFTPLFKAGWFFAAVIVCLSIVSGVFVYTQRRQHCPIWLPDPTAIKTDANKTDHCITFERATTPAAWERGLSGRASMPVNRGMLFVFNKSDAACFWMKDMKFDLDIIWLDAAKRVVYAQYGLSPATYPNTYCPDRPAQYVLEVNAGVAKAAGIGVGSKINL